MSGIWVVVQHRDGKLHRMSREALAMAQQLGSATGDEVEAIVLGSGIDSVADELAGYALKAVRCADDAAFENYTPGGYVAALNEAVRAEAPAYVVFAHSYQSVDYMARLAQAAGAHLLPEIVSFESGDEGIVWSRPVLGGKLQAKVRVRKPGTVVVSVQSGAYSGGDAESGSAPKTELGSGGASTDREILGVEEVAGEQVDLSAADAVVAVGRGIGDADKMGIIEELAQALGAEIGASRPVIDNGWLARDRQIGSSGQTVAPKLYVAVGISGAIQHLVGMKGASTIVSINKDAGAPIFSVSDYGVVGDLHEIVPALTQAVLEAKAEG